MKTKNTYIKPDFAYWPAEELDKIEAKMSGGSGGTGTPAKTKAIIIVPGIAGTALNCLSPSTSAWPALGQTLLLMCTETGESVYNIMPASTSYGVNNIYETLSNDLNTSLGGTYDVLFFPYDWRFSCAVAAASLESLINGGGYTEVVLVAHSMGGLVASSYLARSAANRSKTKKLITLGTPYLGSPKAVYVMETGKLFGGALDYLFGAGFKAVAPNMPSVYELLPPNRNFTHYIKKGTTTPDNYQTTTNFLKTLSWCKKSNGTVKPMITNAAVYHANLVNAGMTQVGFSGVETHKFYGNIIDTIYRLRYDSGGNYIGVDYANAGDGTVMSTSARDASYVNIHEVTQDHTEMVKNTSVINRVINVIIGISTMSTQSLQAETVNENGWLVGPQYDNRRISVDVGGAEQILVTAAGGETVTDEGEILYKVHSDGSAEQTGVSCILGGGYDKKYYLRNGEYNFSKPASAGTETVSFRIEYYNDGYLEKTITFENLTCSTLELSVKDYSAQDAECFVDGASEAITPTSVQ